MAKAARKARKVKPSDIFIYRLESGGYSTEPSPFIIRDTDQPIRIRNMADTRVRLRFKKPFAKPMTFSIGPNTSRPMTIPASLKPGVYEYKVEFAPPRPVSGLQQLPRTYAQGHSSPKMIVDT